MNQDRFQLCFYEVSSNIDRTLYKNLLIIFLKCSTYLFHTILAPVYFIAIAGQLHYEPLIKNFVVALPTTVAQKV
jgi:hypothetical protein